MNAENPSHTPLPGDDAIPYRQLFESANDGMVLLNGETGRILRVNRAFAEMSGFAPDELTGKPLWEIAPMQSTDAGLVAFRELLTRDHIYYDVLPFERRAAKRISVDLACMALRTGGAKLIQCTFRDITRRREIEDELERSEARFKALFRSAPLGIAFVDNEGWIIESNSTLDRAFGYRDHELRGKHFSHFSYPDDQATDETLFRELVEGKRDAYHQAMRYLRKDGGTAWGLLGAAAVRSPNGGVQFIIRMVEDITEPKQAEETLLRSRDFYRSLLNELPNPIRLADTDGNCDYFNRAWLDFTGLQQAQELGVGWTQGIHPEDAERVLSLIHDSLSKRSPFVMEYRLRRASGEYRWLIEFGSPFNGMDGRFAGYISSCYDIHERKALEDALHAISMTDDLTGLLNRRGFSTLADQQIKIANRTKRGMLLVYTDLDGLKLINDTQGHREGDRALIETAALLREVFRESDIIGRLGGDKFAVLMMEDAGDFDDTTVLDRWHAAIRSRNARAAGRSLLSMSNGVQPYDPEHHCSLDKLIEQAPENPSIIFVAAHGYLATGDTSKTRAIVDGVPERLARNFQVLLSRALLLAVEGKRDEGVSALGADVLKYAGTNLRALGRMPEIYSVLDRRDNSTSGAYAFELNDADGVTLSRLGVLGAYDGIFVSNGSANFSLQFSRVFENANAGLNITDAASSNPTITDNQFYGDLALGANYDQNYGVFSRGQDPTVLRNQAYHLNASQQFGIYLENSGTNILVRDNLFFNNSDTGLVLIGSYFESSGNVAYFNNRGFYYDDNGGTTISRAYNDLAYNNGTGFELRGAALVWTRRMNQVESSRQRVTDSRHGRRGQWLSSVPQKN